MNDAQKIAEEIDLVTEGFARVDIVKNPQKVGWGDAFFAWPLEKQRDYLMKFAESMNHAAATIQDERDHFAELAEKKEQQLAKLNTMMAANANMLQTEVTKMNEYKQDYNAHVATLNEQIRELKQQVT